MAHKMTVEDRIAHFLRLAEDPGSTQHERDVAAEQAERLMIKHGIDQAMLPDQQVKENITVTKIFFGGAYAKDRMYAAHAVVRALKLQAYKQEGVSGTDLTSGKAQSGIKYSIVGFESDVRDAVQLVGSLDLQASLAVKDWVKAQNPIEWKFRSQAAKTIARRSFISAFGSGAAKRIRESRRVVIAEEPDAAGTALVLASREEQVADYFNNLPNMGKARARSRQYDGRAGAAGRSAGYEANTGSRSLSASQRSLSR